MIYHPNLYGTATKIDSYREMALKSTIEAWWKCFEAVEANITYMLCGRVIRPLHSKSGGPGFKSGSKFDVKY